MLFSYTFSTQFENFLLLGQNAQISSMKATEFSKLVNDFCVTKPTSCYLDESSQTFN
jgi:hypothetical protein